MKKDCKYCQNEFEPRRKNHAYCCNSCKTMASYKRNNFRYIPGHYQKENHNNDHEMLAPLSAKRLEEKIETIEKNVSSINVNSIANAALGTAAVDTLNYGLKKVFKPSSLPATKEDVEILKNELKSLKTLILLNNRPQ